MNGVLSVAKRLVEDRLAMCGIIIVGGVVAIFAPYLATHPDDVWNINPAYRLQPPSFQHFLGTDRLGADIYSRILFGARITILIALIAAGVSLLIGVPIGLIAGYYRTWFSDVPMRVADVFLSIPQVVLAIAIAQTLGPSIPNVIIALSVTFWPWFARLTYAETRRLKNETFIEALAALGAGPFRIIGLHILPNILPAVIVRTSITMGFAILTAATLGFLGLGAQPPTPEWGRMIAEAREFLPSAWWYAAAPGLAIFAVVMGFNLLGDGLRDVLDPRLRKRRARRVPAAANS
jgi:peptide/nickel transport system permease protein